MQETNENVVVLDACVLYPAPLRDFLLHIASVGIYQPKWSEIIHDEWSRNLLKNRQDLSEEKIKKTIQVMNNAFPDALVTNFESFITNIILPDEDDRHVVATAIKTKAKYIITFNLKDFPLKKLRKWEIVALHPDNFIFDIAQKNPQTVQKAFENQVNSLKNPPKTKEGVLESLKNCGLENTVNYLHKLYLGT